MAIGRRVDTVDDLPDFRLCGQATDEKGWSGVQSPSSVGGRSEWIQRPHDSDQYAQSSRHQHNQAT